MQMCTEESTLKSSTRDSLKVPLKMSLPLQNYKTHIEKKNHPSVRVSNYNKKFD